MKRTMSIIGDIVIACASVVVGAAVATPASAGTGATVTIGARPAPVPANYVLTPDGYFDPHCVYQLNSSQVLVPDGSRMAVVTISARAAAAAKAAATSATAPRAHPAYNLTKQQIAAAPHIGACTHPSYAATGRAISPAAAATRPTVNGWVESGSATSPSAMSYSHTQWNVPAAPSTKSTQTVYFFPGFENLSGSAIIMQPVLAWNQGGSGISGWSGASWNCCSVGNVYHSGYIKVTGSTISGDIGGTGCSTSTKVCSNWSIVTYDWGSQVSTTFNTTPGGRVMNWTFGGALEAYSVTTCEEYPGTSVEYQAFYLDNITGAHIATPTWTHNNASPSITPKCGYSISGTTTITLRY